jgi:hypothetical protein
VDLSGIIFVLLAVAWAVYLVPKVLRHHDEVVRTRSVERFSTAMRVLARREPVDRRTARLVVSPARSGERVLLPARPTAATEASDRPDTSPLVRRAAARAAARRRRRILGFLLCVDLVVLGLAGFAVLPWWAVAVPSALTVLYLSLCRTQVRRENDSLWEAPERRPEALAPRRAIRIDAPYGTPKAPRSLAAQGDVADEEDTVQIPVESLETVAVAVETVDGGSLWDPLPVTLPTYVGKARASRSVRTIDLADPDTWSSGRDEGDTALVGRASAENEAAQLAAEHETRRAVGS